MCSLGIAVEGVKVRNSEAIPMPALTSAKSVPKQRTTKFVHYICAVSPSPSMQPWLCEALWLLTFHLVPQATAVVSDLSFTDLNLGLFSDLVAVEGCNLHAKINK